jgi:hypothetical protein
MAKKSPRRCSVQGAERRSADRERVRPSRRGAALLEGLGTLGASALVVSRLLGGSPLSGRRRAGRDTCDRAGQTSALGRYNLLRVRAARLSRVSVQTASLHGNIGELSKRLRAGQR